ncbi:unnamed protein product [Phytophthora lilii]|uniref:Unnamed protein product n=1 Tax=Phytophthora lilii TaxID=2077276 RepID=A0A9W6WLL9_9STRA|nr:unnamed protein product [Phytophthora lilii]
MKHKKRRRSESFQADQGGDDAARQRLAAFHARMFELPQKEASVEVPDTPRVTFKAKHKKQKKSLRGDDDDGEGAPVVKLNKKKTKKKVEKKMVPNGSKKVSGKPSIVLTQAVKQQVKKIEKKKEMKAAKSLIVKKQKSTAVKTVKKVQVVAQAPQWHSMKKDDAGEDDEVDPLEQALGSIKEIVTKQTAKPPRKKQKVMSGEALATPKMKVSPATDKNTTTITVKPSTVSVTANGVSEKQIKKRNKKKRKQQRNAELNRNDGKSSSSDTQSTIPNEVEQVLPTKAAAVNTTEQKCTVSTNVKAQSLKPPSLQKKKGKKSLKVNAANSESPKTLQSMQPRQGKPLIVTEKPENEKSSHIDAKVRCVRSLTITAPVSSSNSIRTAAVSKQTKAVSKEKKVTKTSAKPLTQIASSLAKNAQKKGGMFLPVGEMPPQRQTAPTPVVGTLVPQLSDESSESEEDGKFGDDHSDDDDSSLFSRLIDSAARERWELVEVGRLVRLFAAQWDFKESKTAQFLHETCPELVSVDFLEGLGVNLSAKQLVQIFEAGSGNSEVLMNKMASAVENGHLSVRDPSFVSALERRVAVMESNAEVMELLHPLMESLSTVRDVGCLLKQLCEHWQLERKLALVQQVLLSNVFDDLDGNQDDILLDMPDLKGRLDFPSRLDQEDIDENGNLRGFVADEDSEFSEVEDSEEDLDEEDSEADEEVYEGETDSDEDVEITGRSRGRNHYIEDEADVGDEEEDEEEDEEKERHEDDGSSSSSDSDDEMPAHI